jgi:hypothetical protein
MSISRRAGPPRRPRQSPPCPLWCKSTVSVPTLPDTKMNAGRPLTFLAILGRRSAGRVIASCTEDGLRGFAPPPGLPSPTCQGTPWTPLRRTVPYLPMEPGVEPGVEAMGFHTYIPQAVPRGRPLLPGARHGRQWRRPGGGAWADCSSSFLSRLTPEHEGRRRAGEPSDASLWRRPASHIPS